MKMLISEFLMSPVTVSLITNHIWLCLSREFPLGSTAFVRTLALAESMPQHNEARG